MTALFALLFLAAPSAELLWGIQLGTSMDEVTKSFRPSGEPRGLAWSRSQSGDVAELSYRCPSAAGCFSVPAAAQFYFLKGRLAAVTFQIRQEQAPSDVNVNLALRANVSAADFERPVAAQSMVGRRIRYFHRRDQTLVWAQDGPDADLKWYADTVAPVGIAEAVASGAQLKLEQHASAAAYANAHRAIISRDYGRSIKALDSILVDRKASPLLKREASYVLAMVLAAEVKAVFTESKARTDETIQAARAKLKRAESLAPALKDHLQALTKSLGLE